MICPPQVNVYFCCSCQILSFGAIIVLAIEIRHFSNASYDAFRLFCAVFHSTYVSSRVVRAYSQSETANQFDHLIIYWQNDFSIFSYQRNSIKLVSTMRCILKFDDLKTCSDVLTPRFIYLQYLLWNQHLWYLKSTIQKMWKLLGLGVKGCLYLEGGRWAHNFLTCTLIIILRLNIELVNTCTCV